MLDKLNNERIYCYVADAVEILWNILLFGREPIYNVGAKEKITILGLAQKVAKILGAEVVLPQGKGAGVPGAAPLERLGINKIETEFGKKAFLPLDEGMERTISWMREQRKDAKQRLGR